MLSVYTRHYPPCPQTDSNHRRCRCPKWINGTLPTGKFVRQELLSEFESLLRGAETALEAAELGARRLNDEELLLKPNGHSTPCARTGAHTDAGRSNFNTQAPVNRSPM
jgi:hypothetical protein